MARDGLVTLESFSTLSATHRPPRQHLTDSLFRTRFAELLSDMYTQTLNAVNEYTADRHVIPTYAFPRPSLLINV